VFAVLCSVKCDYKNTVLRMNDETGIYCHNKSGVYVKTVNRFEGVKLKSPKKQAVNKYCTLLCLFSSFCLSVTLSPSSKPYYLPCVIMCTRAPDFGPLNSCICECLYIP